MGTLLYVFLGFIAGSLVAGVLMIGGRLVKIEKKLDEIIRSLKSG
jgi:hypothetical protein